MVPSLRHPEQPPPNRWILHSYVKICLAFHSTKSSVLRLLLSLLSFISFFLSLSAICLHLIVLASTSRYLTIYARKERRRCDIKHWIVPPFARPSPFHVPLHSIHSALWSEGSATVRLRIRIWIVVLPARRARGCTYDVFVRASCELIDNAMCSSAVGTWTNGVGNQPTTLMMTRG